MDRVSRGLCVWHPLRMATWMKQPQASETVRLTGGRCITASLGLHPVLGPCHGLVHRGTQPAVGGILVMARVPQDFDTHPG